MARAQELFAQIASLGELREIVGAIRAMAASQMQQSQSSLAAVRNYIAIIRQALAEATAVAGGEAPPLAMRLDHRSCLVIFGAEHGFCGAFNDALITAADGLIRELENPSVIFAGTRGAQRMAERELHAHSILPMATHCSGVGKAARRVAAELYRLLMTQRLGRVEIIHMRLAGGGTETTIERKTLLPLEPIAVSEVRNRLPPLVNMKPDMLRDQLAFEYMFAMLEAAALESFASENAARFRTMEAANENIERKITQIDRLARRIRQEAITAEILELIGGAEAANHPSGSR
jgi:F-type H+-transporting ATPase subunit gamma